MPAAAQQRFLRMLCSLALLFIGCAALLGQIPSHGAHATFAQWRNCGSCTELLNSEVKVWRERGLKQGLPLTLLGLAQEIRVLEAASAEEQGWRDNFLARLGVVLSAPAGLNGLFEPHPADAFSGLNTFAAEPARGIAALAIADGDRGPAARGLWRGGQIAHVLLVDALAPARAESLAAFRQAADRWRSFQANAMADQFPWESFSNAFLFPGTLAQPPTGQLRFLHPELASLLSPRSRVAVPVLAVEVVGWRRFDPTSLEPSWGLSLFVASKPAEGRKEAFGLLVSFRNFSLGLCAPQRIEGRRENQVIAGLKLTRLVKAKREHFRRVNSGVEQVLSAARPD
jgi:hypothetical protein